MITPISDNNLISFDGMLQEQHHIGRTIKVGGMPQAEIYQLLNSIRWNIRTLHISTIRKEMLDDSRNISTN